MHNTGTISGHTSKAENYTEKRSKSRKEHRSGSGESFANHASSSISNGRHYDTEVKNGKKAKIISSFTAQQPLIKSTLHDTQDFKEEQ